MSKSINLTIGLPSSSILSTQLFGLISTQNRWSLSIILSNKEVNCCCISILYSGLILLLGWL